jgi:hypothetical protein
METQMAQRITKLRTGAGSSVRFLLAGEKMYRSADLGGLIARYSALVPLNDPALFRKGKVIDWGAAIGWPGGLDIGVRTLVRLSEEQAAFSNEDFRAWQSAARLSNGEAANVLGVSLATVKNYRSYATIPAAISIACRAMQNDPAVLAAHFSPRQPRSKAA